jgi:hypothetical protein
LPGEDGCFVCSKERLLLPTSFVCFACGKVIGSEERLVFSGLFGG